MSQNKSMLRALRAFALAALLAAPLPLAAQAVETRPDTVPVELEALEVVGVTRSSVPLAAIPGAVTVLTRAQVEDQAELAPRLGQILTQLVPGLGTGTETVSNYGQNLRGRTVLVLIDGVPQSTSRNVTRDFVNIDPAMIERVEVLRGATSVYGDGATGGVINIVTRRGVEGRTRFSTQVGVETSLSDFGAGVGPRVAQSVSGKEGAFDFLASGAFARTGGLFDAEGHRIPPDPAGQGGFADTRSYDLLGKVGYTFGAQRLQLMANHFRSDQDTEFTTAPVTAPGAKSQALPGLELERGQGTENTLFNLEYLHPSLLGSRVRAQAYHRDYQTVFRPFDARRSPAFGSALWQSYIDSEKSGGRLDVERPLPGRAGNTLLAGLDYTAETTSQPVWLYDPAEYDRSNGMVLNRTGEGRILVPPIGSRSLAAFVQLAWSPLDRVLLRGGARHERARVSVDDFTTIAGNPIRGGVLEFTPTLFNLGATLEATDALSVYGNFSQGFSFADVGLVLRTAPAGFDLGSREADAQRVDQYEVGVRGSWPGVQASLAAFRNASELGTSLQSRGEDLVVLRAPERVYGAEATLDAQPVDRLGVGGTVSWVEGEYQVGDTLWRPLNTFRIQPVKVTGYLEHRTLPGWSNRLQVLYSGGRDRAFDDAVALGASPDNPGFGLRRVESYTVVDLLTELRAGPGELSVGIRNLLNEQYFPVVSQLMPIGPASYSAAPGATLSVGYSVRY